MKLIDLIKRQATLHGPATYDLQEHRWKFQKISEKRKGIYIFVDSSTDDILKIGKSDRANGLGGRLEEYRTSSKRYLLNPSSSASVIKRVQETSERRLEIDIYYIPIDPVPVTVAGIAIQATPARELEHTLAKMARVEGHSLRFSKQC